MPPTDMQLMEMEMVEGMYDTYSLLSMDPPTYSVLLAATSDDPPELRITFVYDTEDYPEAAAPTVQLEHISKHRRMQTAGLLKEIEELCQEQIGMHSAIAVLQKAQEFLIEYAAIEEKAELQRRGDALAASAIQNAVVAAPDPTVRIGTAVTRELFEEWSRKRSKEKLLLHETPEIKAVVKLTGRQLWDSTLKSADWELFGGGVDDDADADPFTLEQEEDSAEYDLDD